MIQFFCERCGGLFNTKHLHQKRCRECAKKAWTEYNSGYQKNKRDVAAAHDGTAKRLENRIKELREQADRLELRLNRIREAAAA